MDIKVILLEVHSLLKILPIDQVTENFAFGSNFEWLIEPKIQSVEAVFQAKKWDLKK